MPAVLSAGENGNHILGKAAKSRLGYRDNSRPAMWLMVESNRNTGSPERSVK